MAIHLLNIFQCLLVELLHCRLLHLHRQPLGKKGGLQNHYNVMSQDFEFAARKLFFLFHHHLFCLQQWEYRKIKDCAEKKTCLAFLSCFLQADLKIEILWRSAGGTESVSKLESSLSACFERNLAGNEQRVIVMESFHVNISDFF